MLKRVARLLAHASEMQVDGFLLHLPENIRYFSGYTGEGAALILPGTQDVITDFRYVEQAQRQAPLFSVHQTVNGNDADVAADLIKDSGIARLGVEQNTITLAQYRALEKAMPGVNLLPVGSVGQDIRAVKDAEEIFFIRKACEITDRLFRDMLGIIRPGMTEKEIALEMGYRIARLGSEGPSFSFIVAGGPNASMPHAAPTDRPLRQGDVLTLDFGCKVNGYCSDMTRTVAIGEISPEMERVYELVARAQQYALENIRPGMTGRQADALARGIIEKAGYGAHFGHGTGHGVGLQIHESPRLSATAEAVLEPGMIVTVEPGVYLPGTGGVRIEDTCLMTTDGAEALFTAPKSLIRL